MLTLQLCFIAFAASKIPFPWEYKGWTEFPASFFGADPSGLENVTQLAFVSRHQVAGWGWQQGCEAECGSGCARGCPQLPNPAASAMEEQASYKQASALKQYLKDHGGTNQATFVYRQISQSIWWYQENLKAFKNPQNRGFFFRSDIDDSFCWSYGPLWDFRNESAMNYFVDVVIGELTMREHDAVDLVFFDGGVGFLGAAPHPSPSGPIGNSNCTRKDHNYTDAERTASVLSYIETMRRAAIKLNDAGMIPVYSIELPFDATIAKNRGFPGNPVLTEMDVYRALENVTWMRYYEWFQASGWSESIGMSVENMVQETQLGIPVMAHAYPGKTPMDIGAAVAAFLIGASRLVYNTGLEFIPLQHRHGGLLLFPNKSIVGWRKPVDRQWVGLAPFVQLKMWWSRRKTPADQPACLD
eukprot:m.91396 g.91396  ORF g.91396 m.91396 type:complete len:414 (-) comp13301_c0_seq7:2565-3806(-)